jgi:hypothetical protein
MRFLRPKSVRRSDGRRGGKRRVRRREEGLEEDEVE